MTALIRNVDKNPLIRISSIQFKGINNAEIIIKIPSPIPKAPFERMLKYKRNSPGKNLKNKADIVCVVMLGSPEIFI